MICLASVVSPSRMAWVVLAYVPTRVRWKKGSVYRTGLLSQTRGSDPSSVTHRATLASSLLKASVYKLRRVTPDSENRWNSVLPA